MALNRLFQAMAQQQSAPAQPALGSLQKAPVTQPAPFQSSGLPWQQQIGNAIDFGNSSGDAWNAIGRDGVIGYMGDSLTKKYGTNDLSKFRYVEDANVPGGYRLDWEGRQPGTGLVGGLRDAARSFGFATGGGSGAGGDGMGGGFTPQNAAEALPFGVTWEGKGGTNFNLYRKPDGSVGIKTGGQTSNDTADALMAAAVVGGGMLGGQFLGGMTGGGAAAGAAGSGAGFVGEGALSGIGAWDAALAGAPSWTAAGGLAGGAGITDLGGGISMGADGAITGATGAVPSSLGNAGIMESVGAGGSGVGGIGGAGGSGGGGVPPPANPYNPASYLDATNLSNLAKSGMSNFSWTDLIGPGMQLLGGAMNAKAAGDASADLLTASREAAARFEPWRQAGAWGIGQGATMMGKEGPEAARAAFQADPGYQWRQEQGEKALTRNAAARGLLGSGKFLKDAMRFNQGEATQEFGNSFNRLMTLAGMGQTATQSATNYLTDGASAAAAGKIGQANAYTNALGQGMSMYNNNRLMRGLGY